MNGYRARDAPASTCACCRVAICSNRDGEKPRASGSLTLDIVGSKQSLMNFAELGRFMIFGTIQKGRNRWEGTKVHVRHGLLNPDKFTVPAGLIG